MDTLLALVYLSEARVTHTKGGLVLFVAMVNKYTACRVGIEWLQKINFGAFSSRRQTFIVV